MAAETELRGVISFGADTGDAEDDLGGLADRLEALFKGIKVGDVRAAKGDGQGGLSGASIGFISGITTAVTQQLLQSFGKAITSLTGLLLNLAKSIATASPTLTAMFGLFSTRLRLVSLQIGEQLAPSVGKLLDILASFAERLDLDVIAARIDELGTTVLPKLATALGNLADIISRTVNVLAQPGLSPFEILQELRAELTRRPAVGATSTTTMGGNFASQAPFLADFLRNGLNARTPAPPADVNVQGTSEQKGQASDKGAGVIERANQMIFGNAFEMMQESAKAVQRQRQEMLDAEQRAHSDRIGGLVPGLDF